MNHESTPAVLGLSEGLGPTHKCSHCGFSLPRHGGGLRHYGTHTAHQENECLRLLHAEIERLTAALKQANDQLGQASEARWYCLDRDGVAMLCKDEADARAQVIENDDLWPARAPHRAALLCDLEYLRDGGDFIPLAQPRNEQAKQTAELCLSAWATARMDALEAKNAALAREAHTWWTAARDAIKLREPLAPEVIEAAAAEAFGYEGGLQEVNLGDLLHFARVLEQRHGIGA